jgi:ubiquinone/menaquinone biosynthesis C-methylase UbiE
MLDAAGGTGRWARKIATGKRWIVVCDISKRMLLEGAGPQLGGAVVKKLDFVLGTVNSLPFRSKVFRFVLCQHAFFTFPSTEKPLREFMRVLARRGGFFISVQSIYGKNLVQLQTLRKGKTCLSGANGENFVEPEQVKRLIAKFGGRIDRVLGLAFSGLAGTRILFSRRFSRTLFDQLLSLESEMSKIPEFAWVAPHTQIIGTKIR